MGQLQSFESPLAGSKLPYMAHVELIVGMLAPALVPSLMIFGTLRTALQTFHNGVNPRISEWTNQDSLYGNLQLTGTQRVLVEFRPADNYRNYFSQEFEPKSAFHDHEYGEVREAFF